MLRKSLIQALISPRTALLAHAGRFMCVQTIPRFQWRDSCFGGEGGGLLSQSWERSQEAAILEAPRYIQNYLNHLLKHKLESWSIPLVSITPWSGFLWHNFNFKTSWETALERHIVLHFFLPVLPTPFSNTFPLTDRPKLGSAFPLTLKRAKSGISSLSGVTILDFNGAAVQRQRRWSPSGLYGRVVSVFKFGSSSCWQHPAMDMILRLCLWHFPASHSPKRPHTSKNSEGIPTALHTFQWCPL